jgi:hypothetical protein
MGNQVGTLQKKQKSKHEKHPHPIIVKHNTLVPWPTLIILFSEMLKLKKIIPSKSQNSVKYKCESSRIFSLSK